MTVKHEKHILVSHILTVNHEPFTAMKPIIFTCLYTESINVFFKSQILKCDEILIPLIQIKQNVHGLQHNTFTMNVYTYTKNAVVKTSLNFICNKSYFFQHFHKYPGVVGVIIFQGIHCLLCDVHPLVYIPLFQQYSFHTNMCI